MTVRCHEFLECREYSCVMFREVEKRNCWEVEPALTPCLYRAVGDIAPERKIVFCRSCYYYKHMHKPEQPSSRKTTPARSPKI